MKKITLVALSVLSFNAFSVTCDRGPVDKVYITFPNAAEGKTPPSQVNAFFSDGKPGIWKKVGVHTTENNLNRIYTMLLTSQSTGRDIRVVYDNNVSDCDNIPTDIGDSAFKALWLK